ncbi:hypothetical protein [Nocardia sp. NRRL S-836]|uniref:hypothetical protein n=1 Tax=Nocardia sp. NRRL S-836 TaxID=1519492 RepID=UPI000AB807FA|nr:hypothetical protein [Nocardia sp. NRRL S-836]
MSLSDRARTGGHPGSARRSVRTSFTTRAGTWADRGPSGGRGAVPGDLACDVLPQGGQGVPGTVGC